MKIRKGFVSNSSSASFIVEVKGNKKDLFRIMYEEMEIFSADYCVERLKESLARLRKYNQPNKNTPEEIVRDYNLKVKDILEKIKKINTYKEPDWFKIKNLPKDEQDFLKWKHEEYIQELIRINLETLRWHVSTVNNEYVSFRSSPCIIYNGWENIRMHKELVELLSFLSFMGYDVRTRIEEE